LRRGEDLISTLDLVTAGSFLLLCNNSDWANIELPQDLSVTRVVVGVDVADESEQWSPLSGIPFDGALLIRPDQHVAWRTHCGPSESATNIAQILEQLMKVNS